MTKLEMCRKQIDDIDEQMIKLLEQRMNVAREVAEYKRENNLPVLQPGREKQVIDLAVSRLENKDFAVAASRFMENVMELSRASQHGILNGHEHVDNGGSTAGLTLRQALPDGAAGYFGVEGSFTEQALLECLGSERERAAFQECSDVFEALDSGKIVCGVLPIENSSTGSITQVYDLLSRYGFRIVGEHSLTIQQNLVAVPGATLDTINTVYSHEQGIVQSSRFLSGHRDWETVHFHNTAISAQRVAQENDVTKAAIASSRAAEVYGLKIVAPCIQDNKWNTTRFIVIARPGVRVPGANKVSVCFALKHKTGTLYSALRHFTQLNINLVKIESRPIPDMLWNYRFYLDFEGDPQSPEVAALLESIGREAQQFQYLGAYAATPRPAQAHKKSR